MVLAMVRGRCHLEAKRRRRRRRKKFSALDSKFCFTSSLWHTYLHTYIYISVVWYSRNNCRIFCQQDLSFFFSRLSLVCFCRIIIEGKKKVPFLLSFLCQPLSKIKIIFIIPRLYGILLLKNANSQQQQQQQQRKERGEQNSSVAHKQQTDIGDDGDNDDDDDDDDDDVSIALCASTSLVVETQRRKKSFDRPSAR